MSWRTVFVSEQLWRKMSVDVRRKVLKYLTRRRVINRYAANIAACLPDDVRDEFIRELQLILCDYYSDLSPHDPHRISHESQCPLCSSTPIGL